MVAALEELKCKCTVYGAARHSAFQSEQANGVGNVSPS